jgi:hypothetical protein
MRVVLIDPPMRRCASPDGWERFAFSDIVWGYAKHLDLREGEEALVMGSYSPPPKFLSGRLISVPATSWNVRNIATQYLLYSRYGRIVSTMGRVIVHSPDYFSLAVISRRAPEIVPVITTPGSILERTRTFNPYGRVFTSALKWATRVLNARSAHVLATSTYMADWWGRGGFKTESIRVLPLRTESLNLVTRDRAQQQLRWESSITHLLCVAEFRPEMMIPSLVELFAQYLSSSSRRPRNVHLHLVGNGPSWPKSPSASSKKIFALPLLSTGLSAH